MGPIAMQWGLLGHVPHAGSSDRIWSLALAQLMIDWSLFLLRGKLSQWKEVKPCIWLNLSLEEGGIDPCDLSNSQPLVFNVLC